MTERLVVVGGDAAGMSAASAARRERGPDELAIVAFERGNYTSYSACGIPYFIGNLVPDLDALIARTRSNSSGTTRSTPGPAMRWWRSTWTAERCGYVTGTPATRRGRASTS